MVFDEIDTGIGGELRQLLAKNYLKYLKQTGNLYTHLAQIACFAQTHLFINKYIEKNKTKISINILGKQEKYRKYQECLAGEKTAIYH